MVATALYGTSSSSTSFEHYTRTDYCCFQPYFVREEKPVEPVTSFEEESAAFQDVVQEAEKELVMDIPAPTPTPVQEVAEVAMEVTTQPEEEDPAPEMKIEVKAVPEEETVDTLSRELVESMGPLTLRSNSVGLNSLRSTCSKTTAVLPSPLMRTN